jgi:hypothetical protein
LIVAWCRPNMGIETSKSFTVGVRRVECPPLVTQN